ncbi:MAG: zinc ABC transporter substrate-binding protein [Spirochaetales bacterium]|nr:zinc ABC transporter substrate-binding protein [Spirochaetales bacterium]
MNKIIAIIIILAACGTGVYFIFFFNKTEGAATSTPRPSLAPDEDNHSISPIDKPLNIVVSTDLIKEVLYQFARERTNEPYICIKTGVNPLIYIPTKEDEEKIRNADLVLYLGLGIEPGLEAFLNTVKDEVRCEPLSGILEKEFKEMLMVSHQYKSGYDPHFWWNPRVWEKVILGVVHILSDIDPQNEFNYGSIFIRYGQALSLLDRRYIESWSGRLAKERRFLVTLHPAFTYFAVKYGFETMSLYTVATPDTVSPGRRKQVAEYIVAHHIPAIFPEVGFPLTEIESLQAEVKAMGYEVKIGEPLYSYFLSGEGSRDFLYLHAGRTLMNRIYYGLKTPEDPEMPDH